MQQVGVRTGSLCQNDPLRCQDVLVQRVGRRAVSSLPARVEGGQAEV